MKVLLVNPLRFMRDGYISPPIHLLYIAQAIRRAGHDAEIVDLPYEFNQRPHDFSIDDDSGIDFALNGREFDMLGIGGVVSSYAYAERLVKRCREVHPGKPIIIGGSLGQPLRDVWAANAPVEFMVESDGELVIDKLVQVYPHDMDAVRKIPGLWYLGEDGAYHGNEPELPENLDYIPFLDYDEVDIDYFVTTMGTWVRRVMGGNSEYSENERFFPLIMSRGCVYDCTFCFHFNRMHRKHSATYIADNIEYLQEKYGATSFNLLDDLTIIDKKWLHEVCDEIISRGLKVSFFSGGGKPSIVDKEILLKMREAGFKRLSYGIETGSQTILKIMNKRTTVEDNRNAVRLMQEVGMPFTVNIVFGMPGECERTMNETRDFLIDLDLTSANYYAALATPYPGSPLFRWVLEKGLVTDTHDYLLHIGGYADYRINMTEMPRKKFLHKVVDVAFRVDVAHALKRHKYLHVAKLYLLKYAKLAYYGLFSPELRGRIRLSDRYQAFKKSLRGGAK